MSLILLSTLKAALSQYFFFDYFNFDDDIFFLNRSWSEEFAEKYNKEIHFPFTCNDRANVTDKAIVKLMKSAGCHHLKFGLENGNEYISNEVLGRHLTDENIMNAFALCKSAGLVEEKECLAKPGGV